MGVAALTEAIDRLVSQDPAGWADEEAVLALHRERARLDALCTAATVVFGRNSDEWQAAGAKSFPAWLAARCRIPQGSARRMNHVGRKLTTLPRTGESWQAGEITEAHAIAIVRAADGRDEQMRRDEKMIVDWAKTMRFSSFARALRYWEHCAEPDRAERDAERQRSRRELFLSPSYEGMWFGKITLDPVSGAIVSGELERIEDEMFRREWADARDRLEREPTLSDLERTSAQRRADALVEMATRSATMPKDGRRPAPLFSAFVDYETLHGRMCELAQGIPVTPGCLLPYLEEADIERAVFRPDGRVTVSELSRFFTGADRRAIMLRDHNGCTHPFCEEPAWRCEVDHIVPWSEGGPTTQRNGRLLCRYHNRLRNQRPPPDG